MLPTEMWGWASKFKEFTDKNFKFDEKNLMKMVESALKRQKTLWEKEKWLVTSNSLFSHRVFKILVLRTGKNKCLFGKG